jgi:hypothetical protein
MLRQHRPLYQLVEELATGSAPGKLARTIPEAADFDLGEVLFQPVGDIEVDRAPAEAKSPSERRGRS